MEVRARDRGAARSSTRELCEVIARDSGGRSFDEVRYRVVMVLTIATRAAYDEGAHPDRLFGLDIEVLRAIEGCRDAGELQTIAEDAVEALAELIPPPDERRARGLDLAVEHIRRNCSRPIARAEVARILGCSESYVSALFRRLTGHTFKETVIRYRLERARKLLERTSSTVTEVAFEVGYEDPNYFSAAFKKATGVSPGMYRKLSRRRPAGPPREEGPQVF